MVRADQKRARAEDNKKETPTVTEVHVLEESVPKKSTIEEGEQVEIAEGKMTRVATELEPGVKADLVSYLKRNLDIFARDVHDLTGINPELAEHHLNTNKGAHPSSRGRDILVPRRIELSPSVVGQNHVI